MTVNTSPKRDALEVMVPLLAGIDLGIGLHLVVGTRVEIYALLIILSLSIGFLAAGAGLGGAILTVPVFLWLRHSGFIDASTVEIAGLASLGAVVSSYRGTRVYRREGVIDGAIARRLGGIGVVAAVMTNLWAYHWSGRGLLWFNVLIALLGALFLWLRPPLKEGDKAPIHRVRLYGGTVLVAMASGITGMPGSFLLIPLMLWSTPLSYRTVTATVLQVIFYVAVVSCALRVIEHLMDWNLAIPMIIGSWIGSAAGSRWGLKTAPKVLRMVATAVILSGVLFSALPLI